MPTLTASINFTNDVCDTVSSFIENNSALHVLSEPETLIEMVKALTT